MKKTINQEIELLTQKIDNFIDTDPDFLPEDVRSFQNKVLSVHAHIERVIESKIIDEINGTTVIDRTTARQARLIIPLLNEMSFMKKIDILILYHQEKYSEVDNFRKALKSLNKLRVSFAHPVGFTLRNKYSSDNAKGLQNIRDLYRCIDKALIEMTNFIQTTNSK